jgi:RNA polymerase sigma-70 factor (ECF subfamily)
MIKITPLTDEGDGVTRLRVDGRILSKTTDALERACRAGLGGRWPLLLDLSGVSFVDADGAVLLTTLVGRGAVVIGASPFVSEFLRSATQSEGDESARGGDGDPDATLVARLRRGDDDAFDEMSRRFAPRMLAVARRMLRSDEDARDAVQEAFVSAFKSLDRFEGHAKLSTWLHRIVVNAALMRLRTKKRKPEESIDDLLPTFDDTGHFTTDVAPADLPSDALERRELRATVRRCIDLLPESYRAVVLLRDIEELSAEETAEALGMTTSAVKSRLHRARQALHTLLVQARLGEPETTRPGDCDPSAAAASHHRG